MRSNIAHVDAASQRRYASDATSTLFVADTATAPLPLSFASAVSDTPEHWANTLRRWEERATGERGRAEAMESAVLLTFQSGQATWQCTRKRAGHHDAAEVVVPSRVGELEESVRSWTGPSRESPVSTG